MLTQKSRTRRNRKSVVTYKDGEVKDGSSL